MIIIVIIFQIIIYNNNNFYIFRYSKSFFLLQYVFYCNRPEIKTSVNVQQTCASCFNETESL